MWWIFAAGCVDTIRFPPDLWGWSGSNGTFDSGLITGDTGTPADDGVRIETITAEGCSGEDGWLFGARTDAWTLGGTLDLLRTSDQRAEAHPMEVVGTDPDGGWDALSSGLLADGADPAAQQTGVSSVFDCASDPADLTFAVRVWDRTGVLADCVVWGDDLEGMTLHLRSVDPDLSGLRACRVWPFEEAR